MNAKKGYSGLADIEESQADDEITPGCLVLEGGAWRGIYTQGALDALMVNGLNFQATVGVSAGAMSGVSYVSGQIGRSARINLSHRHDPDYVGRGAFKRDGGIIGFSYLFNELSEESPFDRERFFDPRRRFAVVATNIETRKPVFFEKDGQADIFKAVQASATLPYVSRPVEIDGRLYLDGGLAVKVPYEWALNEGFAKIVVIRTRDKTYRKPLKRPGGMTDAMYRDYPYLRDLLHEQAARYNVLLDKLDMMEESGRIFVLAPSTPVTVGRFEGNMEKLGALYRQGYDDCLKALDDLRAYLEA